MNVSDNLPSSHDEIIPVGIELRAQHLDIVDAFSPQLTQCIPDKNMLYDPLAKGRVKVVRFNFPLLPLFSLADALAAGM